MKKDVNHKMFWIFIPIIVVLSAIAFNFFYDKYHEIKLDKDTKEIITYLMTKDFDTQEEYLESAVQFFEDKGYTEGPESVGVILGEDYLVVSKYHYFNDLKTFLNIFNIEWIDKQGNIDDYTINRGLDRKTSGCVSRYIARLNEYKEATIEKFNEEPNEFFQENETTTTTAQVSN
jgi:hypothetical protein